MKYINRLFFLFFTIFLLSCEPSDAVKTITVNSYSLSIPSFLTRVSNLNEDATLQYQHAWREFYVIVIDENKQEFENALKDYDLQRAYSNNINSYSEIVLDNFKSSISTSQFSTINDTSINGLPAKTLNISGNVEGINAYFVIGIIESKEKYYQIMTWTLLSKRHLYSEKMQNIIHSFREI